MKNLFYAIAIVAIGASAFFGWQVKQKNLAKIAEGNDLVDRNKTLSGNVEEQQDNKKISTKQRTAAEDAKNEAIAALGISKAKLGDLKRTLSKIDVRLEEATSRIEKVDKIVTRVKSQVPGDIRIEDVPEVVNSLKEEEKKSTVALDELTIVREKLELEVSKLQAEIQRTQSKIIESKKRVAGNNFEASVSAVNNDWGFLIIGAGEKSGLTGDSKLLVKRGGRFVGKIAISQLEANQAIAEVVPNSLVNGSVIQTGDRVILEDVRSN